MTASPRSPQGRESLDSHAYDALFVCIISIDHYSQPIQLVKLVPYLGIIYISAGRHTSTHWVAHWASSQALQLVRKKCTLKWSLQCAHSGPDSTEGPGRDRSICSLGCISCTCLPIFHVPCAPRCVDHLVPMVPVYRHIAVPAASAVQAGAGMHMGDRTGLTSQVDFVAPPSSTLSATRQPTEIWYTVRHLQKANHLMVCISCTCDWPSLPRTAMLTWRKEERQLLVGIEMCFRYAC